MWFKNSKHREPPWKLSNSDSGFSISDYSERRKNWKLYNESSIFQPLSGFRIIVHDTDTLPYRTGFHAFHGDSDNDILFVTPTLNLIDKSLESWTPEQRNCFMEGEKNLKYFRIYTKVNCEHECISQAVLETCGCVPFYIISEFKWHKH